jgi:hypothetical protein
MKISEPSRATTRFLWACVLILFVLTEANVLFTISSLSRTGVDLSTFDLWVIAILLCVPVAAGWKGYKLQQGQSTINDTGVVAEFSLQLQSAIIAGYSTVAISMGVLKHALHPLK